jgi:YD repeat-containing protein
VLARGGSSLVTLSGPWTFTWNAENQLVSASLSGIPRVGFTYDALGRRVQKAVYDDAGKPSVTTYTYDLEDRQHSGVRTRSSGEFG